jgi:hypothetical protein
MGVIGVIGGEYWNDISGHKRATIKRLTDLALSSFIAEISPVSHRPNVAEVIVLIRLLTGLVTSVCFCMAGTVSPSSAMVFVSASVEVPCDDLYVQAVFARFKWLGAGFGFGDGNFNAVVVKG